MSDKKQPKFRVFAPEADGTIDFNKGMAVWENESKAGKPYLTFKADRDLKEGTKLLMFPNKPRDEQEPEW
jgi:hypothetical protein